MSPNPGSPRQALEKEATRPNAHPTGRIGGRNGRKTIAGGAFSTEIPHPNASLTPWCWGTCSEGLRFLQVRVLFGPEKPIDSGPVRPSSLSRGEPPRSPRGTSSFPGECAGPRRRRAAQPGSRLTTQPAQGSQRRLPHCVSYGCWVSHECRASPATTAHPKTRTTRSAALPHGAPSSTTRRTRRSTTTSPYSSPSGTPRGTIEVGHRGGGGPSISAERSSPTVHEQGRSSQTGCLQTASAARKGRIRQRPRPVRDAPER